MKKCILIYLLAAICLMAGSCKKYLNVVPAEIVTEQDVFNNINTAQQAWAHLFACFGQNDLYNEFVNGNDPCLAACTDECKDHWESPSVILINEGAWSPTNNPLDQWGTYYQYVRAADVFLANIDNVPIPASQAAYYQAQVPLWKAEARFIRAWEYFQLFKTYGAVPLINTALTPDQALGTKIARNSVTDVVNYITSECDAIATILPLSYANNPSNEGRITEGAALALKARTLLYAASPLFNGNTMYASIKNSDGTQLFPQTYDNNKWLLAANAAQAVLNLGVYQLYQPDPANPVDNYARLFYTREYNETILPLILGGTRSEEGTYLPNGRDPNACYGNGKMSVFQELVDAYEMNNGRPITDPQSGYNPNGVWNGTIWDGLAFTPVSNVSNRYLNRDPRFYATIFFQNDVWAYQNNSRPLEYAWWQNNNGASDGWPKSGTNCETGYGWRKWSDPNVNLKAGNTNANRNFPLIRLAEIYLNYAEAMNEYLPSPTSDVYNAINMVRSRVSMPGLPIIASDNTKAGMRLRIQNERRVEFAFENQRFWDVRRWMIAEQVDNGIMHGLNARPTPQQLTATGLDVNSYAAGLAVFYQVVPDQTRVFLPKHYLFPIPQSEIDIDPELKQNYGW